MPHRILLVDDDPETTSGLHRLLAMKGYEVYEENDPTKALGVARKFQPDFVILDYLMPEMHGGDVAWQLASDEQLKRSKMIICTGIAQEELTHKLPPVRIAFLPKPIDRDALMELLRRG